MSGLVASSDAGRSGGSSLVVLSTDEARLVFDQPDDDKFTFEVWEVMYGDPWKVFEIEYNRKK